MRYITGSNVSGQHCGVSMMEVFLVCLTNNKNSRMTVTVGANREQNGPGSVGEVSEIVTGLITSASSLKAESCCQVSTEEWCDQIYACNMVSCWLPLTGLLRLLCERWQKERDTPSTLEKRRQRVLLEIRRTFLGNHRQSVPNTSWPNMPQLRYLERKTCREAL